LHRPVVSIFKRKMDLKPLRIGQHTEFKS
jgi:hypothetical protein